MLNTFAEKHSSRRRKDSARQRAQKRQAKIDERVSATQRSKYTKRVSIDYAKARMALENADGTDEKQILDNEGRELTPEQKYLVALLVAASKEAANPDLIDESVLIEFYLQALSQFKDGNSRAARIFTGSYQVQSLESIKTWDDMNQLVERCRNFDNRDKILSTFTEDNSSQKKLPQIHFEKFEELIDGFYQECKEFQAELQFIPNLKREDADFIFKKYIYLIIGVALLIATLCSFGALLGPGLILLAKAALIISAMGSALDVINTMIDIAEYHENLDTDERGTADLIGEPMALMIEFCETLLVAQGVFKNAYQAGVKKGLITSKLERKKWFKPLKKIAGLERRMPRDSARLTAYFTRWQNITKYSVNRGSTLIHFLSNKNFNLKGIKVGKKISYGLIGFVRGYYTHVRNPLDLALAWVKFGADFKYDILPSTKKDLENGEWWKASYRFGSAIASPIIKSNSILKVYTGNRDTGDSVLKVAARVAGKSRSRTGSSRYR
jgi:hypothetical protein